MLFSSITFLYVFLPVVIGLYFITPGKWKNYVLLIASLIFYGWGEPVYSLLMIWAIVQGYVIGRMTERAATAFRRKVWIGVAVFLNIGTLIFFKYTDFFIEIGNLLLGLEIPKLQIALPIGISFYTFQILSYNIDVYRKDVKANPDIFSLATYVSLFPQLIAGPIVRYSQVEQELTHRHHNWEMIYSGARRFLLGLGKKVLIANQLGEFVNQFRGAEQSSTLYYWAYGIGFTLQIYYDFSGYSDMAIGLGRIFGFHFIENFNYPYISKSITEFWRRWHISLGTWFRDYVYIPMGGNRGSRGRVICNLMFVWMLTGLWHGAAWNFLLWGLMYGVLLMVEKYLLKGLLERLPGFFSHGYVLFFVGLGFVLFNGQGLFGAATDIMGIFGWQGEGFMNLVNPETWYGIRNYAMVFAVGIIGATPLMKRAMKAILLRLPWLCYLEPLALAGLLILVTGFLVDGSFNPFLYFRF